MTLGHAPEALAIGYLRNQRLVGSIDDIAAVQVDWETDSVAVDHAREQKKIDLERRPSPPGCGQGTVLRRPDGGDRPDPAARTTSRSRMRIFSC